MVLAAYSIVTAVQCSIPVMIGSLFSNYTSRESNGLIAGSNSDISVLSRALFSELFHSTKQGDFCMRTMVGKQ